MKCPQTGKRLKPDPSDIFLEVEDSDIKYPIYESIINFRAELKEADFKIPEQGQGSLIKWEELMVKESESLAGKINLPQTFRAVALDIPSGSDLFVKKSFQKYKEASILVADTDPSMLLRAKQRYEDLGLKNAIFICCDLNRLPLLEGVIGMVVSMLGFSRIPSQEMAMTEIKRVLRVSGTFIGAFYLQNNPGQQFLSQWGAKAEAFKTIEEIEGFMSDKFDFIDQELVKNKFVFEARKSWPSCGVKW